MDGGTGFGQNVLQLSKQCTAGAVFVQNMAACVPGCSKNGLQAEELMKKICCIIV